MFQIDDRRKKIANECDEPDNEYDILTTSKSATPCQQMSLKDFTHGKVASIYQMSMPKNLLETMMPMDNNKIPYFLLEKACFYLWILKSKIFLLLLMPVGVTYF